MDRGAGGEERGGVGTGGDEDVEGLREGRGGRGRRADGGGRRGKAGRGGSGGGEETERDVEGLEESLGDADVDVGMVRGGHEVSSATGARTGVELTVFLFAKVATGTPRMPRQEPPLMLLLPLLPLPPLLTSGRRLRRREMCAGGGARMLEAVMSREGPQNGFDFLCAVVSGAGARTALMFSFCFKAPGVPRTSSTA